MEDIPKTEKWVNIPLEISYQEIKKVREVTCKKHPEMKAEYLHLTADVENARICEMCIKENNIQVNNYQIIKDLFDEKKQRQLLSYPVLTDSKLIEIIQTISNTLDSEASLIDIYFNDQMREIQDKIEERKKAQKEKLMQHDGVFQQYKVCWSEINDIENLQQILLDVNNEERLNLFVRNHVSNAESNTQKIKTIYDQLQAINDEFSVEQPSKIKILICALLKEINFYQSTHPSPLQSIEQSDEYKNALQRKQKELEDYQSQINQSQQLLFEEKIRVLEEQHSSEITSLKQDISKLQQINSAQQQEIHDLKQDNQTTKKEKQELYQQFNEETERKAILRRQFELEKKSSQLMSEQSIKRQFDLFQHTNLLPRANLILANYLDSKKLSITKNNLEELEFKNKDTQNCVFGLSYLDFIMDTSTNYVVHVQLEQTKAKYKFFSFGLLPDSLKDVTRGINGILDYDEQINAGHLNTYLKGKAIKTNDISREKRTLEMRINIERQILKVGSLPNYESVVAIDDPRKIEPATPYRFFLYGLNKETKISITKLESVSEFNDLM